MPGRLDSNLRQGNFQEELGVLLLRTFCAVAPVPRTEDVGVDVVATLLERIDNRVLFAKENFLIQLKASSVSHILYEGDSLKWLLSLKIPFFVGSVNSKKASISIYTTHRIKVHGGRNTRLDLHLKQCREGRAYYMMPRSYWYNDRHNIARIYLGEPIVVLSLSNIKTWLEGNRIYNLMKKWIEVEDKTINALNTGYAQEYIWKTGVEPIPWQESFEGGGSKYVKSILGNLETPLEALAFHLGLELKSDERKILIQFLNLLEKYSDGAKFGKMSRKLLASQKDS
jgi:hypothetical protein